MEGDMEEGIIIKMITLTSLIIMKIVIITIVVIMMTSVMTRIMTIDNKDDNYSN